jgi:hypothetical protein
MTPKINAYPSMNSSRRRTLDIYILGYQQQGKQHPPSEPMFQSISKLTILHHTVQLSFIDR